MTTLCYGRLPYPRHMGWQIGLVRGYSRREIGNA
jgi:hypothetical protein